MIFDKNHTSRLNLCWIGLGHLNVVDTICWCFLSEDVIIVSVSYGFFSRSSPVDNEFFQKQTSSNPKNHGISSHWWELEIPDLCEKHIPNPSISQGSLVILRETSFFTRSRCLIQPMFFRQNSWSPTNDRPVTHGNMKFGTCIHSSPCTLGENGIPTNWLQAES